MRTIGTALVALALAGCGNDFLLAGLGADETGNAASCVKIEGAQIGEERTLEVGSKSIRFHSWVPKPGEPNEYIGFSIETSGTLVTRVKAGGETWPVDADSWVNPQYAESGEGSAVSNVESCDPDDDGGDNPDDPTGGNPDDPTGGNPDDPTGGTTDPDLPPPGSDPTD